MINAVVSSSYSISVTNLITLRNAAIGEFKKILTRYAQLLLSDLLASLRNHEVKGLEAYFS